MWKVDVPPLGEGESRGNFSHLFPFFFKGVLLYVYMYCCQAPKTGTDSICKCNTASYSFRYVSQSTHAQEHILPVSYWTEQIWYVIFLREAWSYKNGLIFWDSPNGLWKYVAVLRREWRRCLYMKNYQHRHRRNVTSHCSFSFLWLFQLLLILSQNKFFLLSSENIRKPIFVACGSMTRWP